MEIPKELLESLLSDNLSTYKIADKLGISQTNVRYWLMKHGIVKTPSPKRPIRHCDFCNKIMCTNSNVKRYCNNLCHKNYQNAQSIKEWQSGGIDYVGYNGKNMLIKPFIKNYLLEKHDHKCQKCGWGEMHEITKKVPLQIHHIDGNSENCLETNLQVLCPNCHTLTHNYGNLNRNSPRIRK